MDVIKNIQRFVKVLSFLALASFTVSPLTEMFGISLPTQATSIIEVSRTALLITTIGFIAFIAIIFGAGYFILTGFRNHRSFPRPVKVVAAFLFGGVALMLSGVFGLVIPIPILPTLITAIILWTIIRLLSKGLRKTITTDNKNAKMKIVTKQRDIDIEEAERIAIEFIKKRGIAPSTAPVERARLTSNGWEVSAGNCTVNISRKNGGVTGWHIG